MWMDIANYAVDGTLPESQPLAFHNPAAILFFIAFLVVGGFFVLNMLVGVIIDEFARVREASGQSVLLTPAQHAWVQARTCGAHCTVAPAPTFLSLSLSLSLPTTLPHTD